MFIEEGYKMIDFGGNEEVYENQDGLKVFYCNGDLVYSDIYDYTGDFDISDKMRMSIIKYKLSRA